MNGCDAGGFDTGDVLSAGSLLQAPLAHSSQGRCGRMDDAIQHLNTLARDSVKDQVPMRTTEELLHFFKNPPKRGYSVPLEEAMTSIVRMFRMADENSRRIITSRLNVHARNGFLG